MNIFGNGMKSAGLLRAALLGSACLVALSTIPAYADDQTVETVVVTGLIGSLQQDLNIKRDAAGLVDAITMEDIGKFRIRTLRMR